VIPSVPGASLGLKSSIISLNTSCEKYLSLVVSIGCSVSLQKFMCRSGSSCLLSPGMSCSIINFSVSVRFAVLIRPFL